MGECNRLGHLKANCPQLQKCRYCNELGHIVRDCPRLKLAAEVPVRPNSTVTNGQKEKNCRWYIIHHPEFSRRLNEGSKQAVINELEAWGKEKEDDQCSVRSNSTVATRSDLVVVPMPPRTCYSCGISQTPAKYKKGTNPCKDRCKSCFKLFE